MIRSFDGKTPKIAPSAFVSEAAYVVGDVEVGACRPKSKARFLPSGGLDCKEARKPTFKNDEAF